MRKTVLLIFMLMLLTACNSEKTNDIYLLPEDFEGVAVVFYNVNDAPKVKNEGEFTIHNINDEGFFVTSTATFDVGLITDQYFYVDHTGKRKEIDPLCVRPGETGSVEYDNGIKINYTGITVTKTSCGEEFAHSTESIPSEKVDLLLEKVKEKYY